MVKDSKEVKWEAWLIDKKAYDDNRAEVPLTKPVVVSGFRAYGARKAFFEYLKKNGIAVGNGKSVKLPEDFKVTDILAQIRVKCLVDKRKLERPTRPVAEFFDKVAKEVN